MKICEKCIECLNYSIEFDAYFCLKCNTWTDNPCGNPECARCKERPQKPKTQNRKKDE